MQPANNDQWKAGRVKFYDASKRIGFVISHADGRDVFLHLSAVQRSKVHASTLLPDAEVKYTVKAASRPGLRPEVHELRVMIPHSSRARPAQR